MQVTAVLYAAGVVYALHKIGKTKQEHEAIRAKIHQDMVREVEVIAASADIVVAKINNGDYENKGLADVMADAEFYRIAAREHMLD